MLKNQFGGINERPDGTFSITPLMPLGILDADQLEVVAKVVRRFNLPGVRANTAQRITIEGIPAESVDEVIKMLHGIGNRCAQSIIACRGQGECQHGLQNTQIMAKKVEDFFINDPKMPTHLKIGLSGCSRCCGNSYIRDVGLIGTDKGWTLAIGGRSGSKPRCGDEILVDASPEKILATLKSFLSLFVNKAQKKERTAKFVERFGIENIKGMLLNV